MNTDKLNAMLTHRHQPQRHAVACLNRQSREKLAEMQRRPRGTPTGTPQQAQSQLTRRASQDLHDYIDIKNLHVEASKAGKSSTCLRDPVCKVQSHDMGAGFVYSNHLTQETMALTRAYSRQVLQEYVRGEYGV